MLLLLLFIYFSLEMFLLLPSSLAIFRSYMETNHFTKLTL